MLQSSQVHHTPLLVLATSMPAEEADCLAVDVAPPPVQVAEWLSLIHIQHPWQVYTHKMLL